MDLISSRNGSGVGGWAGAPDFDCISILPEEVRGHDLRRDQSKPAANRLEMSRLVRIGKVPHVPGYQVLNIMDRADCHMDGIAHRRTGPHHSRLVSRRTMLLASVLSVTYALTKLESR